MSVVATSPKKFLTIEEQISLLRSRGMTCHPETARWLQAVNYYRLSGYWYTYRRLDPAAEGKFSRADQFVEGTSFSEIATLYEFDRKLRTLFHDGIERVEVALRSHISYVLGASTPLEHTVSLRFRDSFDHVAWLAKANQRVERAARRSPAIKHHQANHDGIIPIWVLVDVLDFSDLSVLFSGMRVSDQFTIAERLGVAIDIGQLKPAQAEKASKIHPLGRWLEQLTVLRNIGAHHGRMWNRSVIPAATAGLRTIEDLEGLPTGQSEDVFGALTVIAKILSVASPGSKWAQKVRAEIESTFAELPGRTEGEMGFPASWREMSLWAS